MNVLTKEFGTAMLVLLIVFAAVLAVCGIATLITKLAKKDSTVLSKVLAVVFAVIALGTTGFYIVQLFPTIKEDKSTLGLLVGGWLVELAIFLMLIVMIVERTKKNWLSLLLSLLPVAYSIYTLVISFSTVTAYPTKYLKVEGFVNYIGDVLLYVAIFVVCLLTTIGVIKNRKKAILFGLIPVVIAAVCFTVRFAFNVQEYTDSLIVTTVFDALRRALMVVWCYGMAVKAGEVAEPAQVAPQAAPQPQFVQQPQQFAQPNVQPAPQAAPVQPQFTQPQAAPQVAPVQPEAPKTEQLGEQPANNGYKFDPITGQPIQPNNEAN